MASEAITRNDLTAILNEVLPSVAVDYIVEQGTSGIWTYRKWASGIAECWATTTISGTWSTWSGHYFIEGIYTYPFTFVSRPSLQAYSPSSSGISSGSSVSVGSYTSQSEDDMKSRCVVALYRPTAGTNNANYTINLYAIGKWK